MEGGEIICVKPLAERVVLYMDPLFANWFIDQVLARIRAQETRDEKEARKRLAKRAWMEVAEFFITLLCVVNIVVKCCIMLAPIALIFFLLGWVMYLGIYTRHTGIEFISQVEIVIGPFVISKTVNDFLGEFVVTWGIFGREFMGLRVIYPNLTLSIFSWN